MRRSICWVASLVTVVAGCSQPTPEERLLNDIARALGGRERILQIRTLAVEGDGRHFNLGQDMTPGASGQTFAVTGLSRRIDLAAMRSRTELTRTPNFAYFQGQSPQKQIQGLDGEVAYNVSATGTATRAATSVADDRRAELYHHPIALMRAVASGAATIAKARTSGTERLADVTTADGRLFVIAVDAAGLLSRIESTSAHPNLGDVVLSTHFADYREVDGVKLPMRITSKTDAFTTAELQLTRQTMNGDVGDLAAPAAAAAMPASAGAPPPTVVVEQIAPWIWLLAGQSHHSVLVEMNDHLLLIDAPQSEARTLAVIAKARELRPGKPLRTIVTTHHHFDHTAGIRAAMAEGLAVLTHSGNREFFEQMGQRPHTLVPDTLAKNPRPVRVDTVDEERVLNDGPFPVALYHVAGNPHSDTMLMVHFPSERVLVEVDAFSPGAAANPYAANLLDNITRRKLLVDRIVSLHGKTVPLAELTAAVGAAR